MVKVWSVQEQSFVTPCLESQELFYFLICQSFGPGKKNLSREKENQNISGKVNPTNATGKQRKGQNHEEDIVSKSSLF